MTFEALAYVLLPYFFLNLSTSKNKMKNVISKFKKKYSFYEFKNSESKIKGV